jgi:hypothetical protein
MRNAPLVAAVMTLLPVLAVGQEVPITPLASHKADEALMERISAVVEPGDVLETPAVLFASVKPGSEEDGLCAMVARLVPGDPTSLVTGRLLCVLLDPEHLSSASVLTVRLLIVEGGERRQVKVAFDTLANEGGEQLQLVRQPNADAAQDVMPVPRVPQPIADAMATVGSVKIGAVLSPRGLHIVLAAAAGGGQAAAFTMPTLGQLKARGIEWSEHTALP